MPLTTGKLPRTQSTEVTELTYDTVILCTSRKSNGALYSELKSRRPEWVGGDVQSVYQVGDCHTPRFIQLAIFEGHRLAREFESKNPQIALPFVRERHIWGEPTYPDMP